MAILRDTWWLGVSFIHPTPTLASQVMVYCLSPSPPTHSLFFLRLYYCALMTFLGTSLWIPLSHSEPDTIAASQTPLSCQEPWLSIIWPQLYLCKVLVTSPTLKGYPAVPRPLCSLSWYTGSKMPSDAIPAYLKPVLPQGLSQVSPSGISRSVCSPDTRFLQHLCDCLCLLPSPWLLPFPFPSIQTWHCVCWDIMFL